MGKSRLEMEFLDGENKKFRISIDDPKEDLTAVEVETAMEAVLSYNIFASKENELVSISGARVITTTVEELQFD